MLFSFAAQFVRVPRSLLVGVARTRQKQCVGQHGREPTTRSATIFSLLAARTVARKIITLRLYQVYWPPVNMLPGYHGASSTENHSGAKLHGEVD